MSATAMEGEKPLKKKKRDVVVVGLKLKPASRELLTWALAKFTTPGDHVVALHIAMQPQSPSSSSVAYVQPAAHRKVDSIFDSVIGVYDGFCRVKQIDLQLKVIRGVSSLRRTLIEEVKRYNAVRLILGTTGTELPINDSSFALAKYCSKHLPCTCIVLVTQHGKVVFEQAGALTSGR